MKLLVGLGVCLTAIAALNVAAYLTGLPVERLYAVCGSLAVGAVSYDIGKALVKP